MNGIDTMYLEKDTNGDWFNGPKPSRAAFFGDGIFETMVFFNGRIRFGDYHLSRLRKGMEILQLSPTSLTPLSELEKSLLNKLGRDGIWRIRWNIFRAGLGKYTPSDSGVRESLFVQPFEPAPRVKSTSALSLTVKLFPAPWANCKTLNALPYVMANLERASRNLDEIVLADHQGYLAEAGAANLFWTKDGTFYTPSLAHNGIAGVGRAALIDHLKTNQHPVEVVSCKTEALWDADQIFTSNVTGVSLVGSFEKQSFRTTPIPVVEQLFFIDS